MNHLRVLFCGSGEFGIPSLKAIAAGPHELVGILTQPPRPAGRGGHMRGTAVAELARDLSCRAVPCDDINSAESLDLIRETAPDVMFVADFGQFIHAPAREIPRHQAYNLHGSLLPELRGAAPVNWAIIRGHRTTGVTTFRLVDRMDAGPVFGRAEVTIDPWQTAEEVRAGLAELGAGLVCRTLDALAAGPVELNEQDESKATRAPKLGKTDGFIDFSAPAADIRNRIHGTWPWPGGHAVLRRGDGEELPVIFARARVETGEGGQAGAVTDDLAIATGSGLLRIVRIKPAGKRLMDWKDFTNGHRLDARCRFITPHP
jgi:methionyl-tRNA formyltransferase